MTLECNVQERKDFCLIWFIGCISASSVCAWNRVGIQEKVAEEQTWTFFLPIANNKKIQYLLMARWSLQSVRYSVQGLRDEEEVTNRHSNPENWIYTLYILSCLNPHCVPVRQHSLFSLQKKWRGSEIACLWFLSSLVLELRFKSRPVRSYDPSSHLWG
jgi:hypothetical protein